MSPTIYYILHVTSVLVLTGYIFYAFAAAPATRKRVMMITGIASVLALVGGFRGAGRGGAHPRFYRRGHGLHQAVLSRHEHGGLALRRLDRRSRRRSYDG